VDDIDGIVSEPTGFTVPFSGLDMNHKDNRQEGAVAYLRSALLNEPYVMDHVLDLASLRDDMQLAIEANSLDQLEPAATHYFDALGSSLLLEQFDVDELDDMIVTARQRIRLGYWGKLKAVNPRGPGYGRQKARARAMTQGPIALAVEDFVRRLVGPDRFWGDLDLANQATVRRVRERVRKLPTL
jgi:hypothetical protein